MGKSVDIDIFRIGNNDEYVAMSKEDWEKIKVVFRELGGKETIKQK